MRRVARHQPLLDEEVEELAEVRDPAVDGRRGNAARPLRLDEGVYVARLGEREVARDQGAPPPGSSETNSLRAAAE